MNRMKHPVTATILFGLAGALGFIPAWTLATSWFGGRTAFELYLVLLAAGYSLILGRIGGRGLGPALFPLAALAAATQNSASLSGFLFLAFPVFGWIRSGALIDGPWFRKILAETLTLGGAAMLLWALDPGHRYAWAVSIWLFFLAQSLYFVVAGPVEAMDGEQGLDDPFDRSRRRAERILAEAGE
jgi:Na+/melibiose symporter-like transporter